MTEETTKSHSEWLKEIEKKYESSILTTKKGNRRKVFEIMELKDVPEDFKDKFLNIMAFEGKHYLVYFHPLGLEPDEKKRRLDKRRKETTRRKKIRSEIEEIDRLRSIAADVQDFSQIQKYTENIKSLREQL